MAIIGLGTDIVEIARIADIIEKSGDKLAKRILAEDEFNIYLAHNRPARYLAKRFATKEAASKALGLGMRKGLAFNQFATQNDENGKPVLSFLGQAREEVKRLGIKHSHLSVTDEEHYAVATVILES